MRCNVCHGPVAFERTVFQGTKPTTIRLCEPCADKIDVLGHLDRIKGAADHAAKTEAIDGLLSAVQTASAQHG
jgi:hypothetical protein